MNTTIYVLMVGIVTVAYFRLLIWAADNKEKIKSWCEKGQRR